MSPVCDPRICLVGTGGQGTLTATRLLAQAAMNANVPVIAGEVHGMAQRGGVVESAVLIGGWRSLRVDKGEADILLGFEALETLRGLPYLRNGGIVFSSDVQLPPLSVCMGQDSYPEWAEIRREAEAGAESFYLVPCREIGEKICNTRAESSALLGALVASGCVPFGLQELGRAVEQQLPEKIRAVNIAAMELGAEWFVNQKNISGGMTNA